MNPLDMETGKYERLSCLLNRLQSPLLLLMRLYWGWQFFQAGKGKLFNMDKTVEFFSNLSIPLPRFSAYLAASTECFGGLLLLVGLGSRLVSIPLAFTMIVAYLTADRGKVLHLFSEPDAFLTAAPFLFLLTSVLVMAFGPGIFSLDRLISYFSNKKRDS